MKDALGNELKVGDMVAIQLARPLIFGQIVEATDGILGVVYTPGKQEPRLGRLVVMSRHIIDVDPLHPTEAVLALRNELGHQAVEERKPD